MLWEGILCYVCNFVLTYSTPTIDSGSRSSGTSQQSLLCSREIKLLSLDPRSVYSSSASGRRKPNRITEHRPSRFSPSLTGLASEFYLDLPTSRNRGRFETFMNVPQPIPRTVTPILSTSMHQSRAGLSWSDESPVTHITSPLTYSRTRSSKHPDVGIPCPTTPRASAGQRNPTCRDVLSGTVSSAVASYPSKINWLDEW